MKIRNKKNGTHNRLKVIDIIRNSPDAYCAQIARETELSLPAVMKIVDKLESEGLVRRGGKIGTPRGKNPEILHFVSDAYYIVGVDVGTTNILAILMDLGANIIYRYSIRTSSDTSVSSIFTQINKAIENVYANCEPYAPKILGIGIGLAGIVNSDESCVVFSPAFKWHDVLIKKHLVIPDDCEVVVENVTKSRAYSEKWFGLAKHLDNMLCVNLGYGIGSALMVDSIIHNGDTHAAGELGHMVVEKSEVRCACGNRGCLEALASANAIKAQAMHKVKDYPDSLIVRLAGDIDNIEAKTVFDAAKAGDFLALEIITKASTYIGLALANVVNLLDISLVVLEGGLTKAGDILVSNIESAMNENLLHSSSKNVRLCVSDLGSDAVAIGAATIVLKRFFENEDNSG